jgi:putative endonuclease
MEKSLIDRTPLGAFGEEEACKFLRNNGCKILCRNYRARGGEIDIIARQGKCIVFVEVKTRISVQYAQPWENVGYKKRRNLKTAAKFYIQEVCPGELNVRFDVISVVVDSNMKAQIEWIQSAF